VCKMCDNLVTSSMTIKDSEMKFLI